MNKRLTVISIISIIVFAGLIWAGFNVPIDSYLTAGCPNGSGVIKLHLINGDSLDSIRDDPTEVENRRYTITQNGPLDECVAPSQQYELYVF